MAEEKKVPETPVEPTSHGFANTKEGQEKEEALRKSNIEEKKKERKAI